MHAGTRSGGDQLRSRRGGRCRARRRARRATQGRVVGYDALPSNAIRCELHRTLTRTLYAGFGARCRCPIPTVVAFNVLLDATLPGNRRSPLPRQSPVRLSRFWFPSSTACWPAQFISPRPSGTSEAIPTQEELEQFLAQLRAAIPGFNVQLETSAKYWPGCCQYWLQTSVQLVKREVLLDHATAGGLKGMYSVFRRQTHHRARCRCADLFA